MNAQRKENPLMNMTLMKGPSSTKQKYLVQYEFRPDASVYTATVRAYSGEDAERVFRAYARRNGLPIRSIISVKRKGNR